ncbi:hypothetical protein D1AOALGA4SA_1138 [Olavius algarvensis Delta 1 endosymbiont]|nr:hypothetical protein D1AOALGA4SA_1138 [Olavius algarvensis Delta 1 endosymbiont]
MMKKNISPDAQYFLPAWHDALCPLRLVYVRVFFFPDKSLLTAKY